MVGARLAGPADAAAISELETLSRRHLDEQRGGDQFAAAGGDPAPDAEIVGIIGDAVVGLARITRAGTRATVSLFFTHPAARGVGVGHAMLAAADETARSWGCTDLDSYALPGDRDTKNFFESHGMKSRLLVVHRPIGGSEPGAPS